MYVQQKQAAPAPELIFCPELTFFSGLVGTFCSGLLVAATSTYYVVLYSQRCCCSGQGRSDQGRAGQDMTVPSLRRLCCCVCTHRAFAARESGVVKHAERTRVVDSATSVTVDVLEKRTQRGQG